MTIDDVKAELARGQAEAVRMLDAWAAKLPQYRAWTNVPPNGQQLAQCVLTDSTKVAATRAYHGESPEAARGNAAEAVRGEL